MISSDVTLWAVLNGCVLGLLVGWASTHVQAAQAAYAQPYAQPYDQAAAQDIGVKGRLINLISAVRTLMRGMPAVFIAQDVSLMFTSFSVPLIAFNIAIIGYELVLGG